ncbi:MAG TPA: ankyrin repeat domain-containing protein, partial [Gemmataceae bacterium]|nr:ankyrin repeat domain-containing protein [Gemmataceae bacterium]
MSQKRYPAKIIEFELAVEDSDIDTMQRIFKEEPDLFRKLRENHVSIVCEAAKESSPEVIRWLIARGADVNEQDSNDWTGLCWAVSYGRYDIAKVLLECGADPHLHCAIFHVVDEDVQDPVALAKLLLDYGADINQPFLVEGLPPRTVLSEAIERGRTDLVKFLKSR